jgi:hypothetical protein
MKKVIFLSLAAMLLSGCVTNPSVNATQVASVYVAENRPKAMSGSINWSTYYQGLIDIAKQTQSVQLSDWIEALNMAKEFEAGRISKEDFHKWREAGNLRVATQNAVNQKNRAQCEYEAKTGAAAVQATGRSGLNFDQMFKEKELFELCMRARQ